MIATVQADWSFEPTAPWGIVPASDETVVEDEAVRWPPRWYRPSRQGDVERRENVQLDEALVTDRAALPGRIITLGLLRREANKRTLVSLLEQFLTRPLTWGDDEPSRVSEETRAAASQFIELLPDEVQLPQIAPDGEGGIVMHWEPRGGRHVLGGVEGWRLHFVVDAGRDNAEYLDDIAFSGESIPEHVLRVLTL